MCTACCGNGWFFLLLRCTIMTGISKNHTALFGEERVKMEHLNYKVPKVIFFKKVLDELTFKYVSQRRGFIIIYLQIK